MDSGSSPLQVSFGGNRFPQLPCSRTLFSHLVSLVTLLLSSTSIRTEGNIAHKHLEELELCCRKLAELLCLYAKSCAGGFSHLQLPDFWNLQDLVVWRNPDITVETRQTNWIFCSNVEIRLVMFSPVYVCMYFVFFWIARVHVHTLVCAFLSPPHPSPHAVPDRLRLRVNRISLQEYDRLQYDKERLRDICERFVSKMSSSVMFKKIINDAADGWLCVPAIPVGIVVVRGDCDLETCRLYIDRLQEASLHSLSLDFSVACSASTSSSFITRLHTIFLWNLLTQMLRLSLNLETFSAVLTRTYTRRPLLARECTIRYTTSGCQHELFSP